MRFFLLVIACGAPPSPQTSAPASSTTQSSASSASPPTLATTTPADPQPTQEPVVAAPPPPANYGGSFTSRDVGGPTDPNAPPAAVPVSNVDRVIAGMRPAFRSCYNKGLQADPSMTGSINVAVKWDKTNTQIIDVTKTGGKGLSPEVEQCVMGAIKKARFDPPDGQSTIVRPTTFTIPGP